MVTRININDTIYAELNDRGWDILTDYHVKLFSDIPSNYPKPKVDEYVENYKSRTKEHLVDGEFRKLTEFQLHDFMNIFGSQSYVGSDTFVINNNIYLTIN